MQIVETLLLENMITTILQVETKSAECERIELPKDLDCCLDHFQAHAELIL